jgi:hypothetical protein
MLCVCELVPHLQQITFLLSGLLRRRYSEVVPLIHELLDGTNSALILIPVSSLFRSASNSWPNPGPRHYLLLERSEFWAEIRTWFRPKNENPSLPFSLRFVPAVGQRSHEPSPNLTTCPFRHRVITACAQPRHLLGTISITRPVKNLLFRQASDRHNHAVATVESTLHFIAMKGR